MALVPALNASSPLAITTYVEGNNEVVHPSVVDAGAAWNGYRYWMAATPYPNTDDQFENPSIWASNDKDTWVVPAGLTNPIEAPPGLGYWSDTHLVLHAGTLYLFFRGVGNSGEGGNEVVLLRTSVDGVTWAARTTVLALDPLVRRCLSPAVVRDAGGTWRMWFIDPISGHTLMAYTAPAATGPWAFAGRCQLPAPNGKQLWHLDVQARNGEYWMLLNVTDSGTNMAGGALYLTRSRDGLTWRRAARPVLGSRGNKWDASLYRGCLVPAEDGAWDAYYGSAIPTWAIGRTTLPLLPG